MIPAGKTYSCEAACPSGQERMLAYEDSRPELKLFVFNGQLQQKYEWSCVAKCAEGERMDRAPMSSGAGTRYTYSCYNVAKREEDERAKKDAYQKEQTAAAQRSAESRAAWRNQHPAMACQQDCADGLRECARGCRATRGSPSCLSDCQDRADACTPVCRQLPR